MTEWKLSELDKQALAMHASGRPGKFEIRATKPLVTQHDLSLAYSPGVAAPCMAIYADPEKAYDYTAKGNTVAVISNGTAVLGLGNLGPLGAKPVMEGKAVLFKRFADIDGVDIEIDSEDIEVFVQTVRAIGRSFGGINLEDIRSPECFVIEQRLRELLDVPVFHDDQHGTAIIASAGFLNAIDIAGKSLSDLRMVVNGAGAAACACVSLLIKMGLPAQNVLMCDRSGVIYRGREKDMNQWKSAFAVETDARSLMDAMQGADVFFGLSAAGAVSPEMVAVMNRDPIIFAMANPDPEISPEAVREVRKDAIIATGRSDYPNQVNNVLGFPYIFRGALDMRASVINDEMKIAAAHALAKLAKEDTPDEVDAAYSGQRLRFGPEYIIPVPFDPRLIIEVPAAVAQAAIDTGVARKPVEDFPAYRVRLRERMDPIAHNLEQIFALVRKSPRRIVFSEGEEERVLRAAAAYRHAEYGEAMVVGREEVINQVLQEAQIDPAGIRIINARLSSNNKSYVELLYARLQRRGYVRRDCQRLVNQDRNVFAAAMVATGDADGMVSGVTRGFHTTLEQVTRVFDASEKHPIFGLTIMVTGGRTLLVADTHVNMMPTAQELAAIARRSAIAARRMGHEPRIAFLSSSNFGNPDVPETKRVRDAVQILDGEETDFEYDGEMKVDTALDAALMRDLFPFCRLSDVANVLIMPDLDAANIASGLLRRLGGGMTLGPLLIGFSHPVQIVPRDASVTDLLNHAAIAAYGSLSGIADKK